VDRDAGNRHTPIGMRGDNPQMLDAAQADCGSSDGASCQATSAAQHRAVPLQTHRDNRADEHRQPLNPDPVHSMGGVQNILPMPAAMLMLPAKSISS
jgi:hypothetical protein